MATYESTDFSKFSHADLILMLQYGDPAKVDEAAAELDSVASFMDTQKATLEDKLTAFEPYWTGVGAQDYFAMMRGLVAASGTIADRARSLRDNLYAARDALAKARAAMPAPVPVSPLNIDPALLAVANGNAGGGSNPAAAQQAIQQALVQYQTTQAAANTANLAAAQVMIALANTDRSLNSSVPTVPAAVPAPQQGDVLTTYNGAYGLSPQYGSPALAGSPSNQPLFGDVYTNGVVSAQLADPNSVPGLIGSGTGSGYPGYGAGGGVPGPSLGDVGAGAAGAGIGAAGLKSALGSGIGGGGLGGPAAVPTGDPGLAVNASAAGPESIAGVAGAQGGAGGVGGAPFMGGMGAGGGMGPGAGNGRLAKSWLVEQDQEIFGVKMGEVLPTELERLLGLG